MGLTTAELPAWARKRTLEFIAAALKVTVAELVEWGHRIADCMSIQRGGGA